MRVLNKIADKADLQVKEYRDVALCLVDLKKTLDDRELLANFPLLGSKFEWLRMWEYSRAIVESKCFGGKKVLDAGGAGTVFSYFLSALGNDVTAIDLNEEFVQGANKTAEEFGMKLTNEVADITSMPFEDGSFDIVFCVSVIEHIEWLGQGDAIKEISRVLKPEGIAVVTFDYGSKGADYPVTNVPHLELFLNEMGLYSIGNKFDVYARDLGGRHTNATFASIFLSKVPSVNHTIKHSLLDRLGFWLRDYRGHLSRLLGVLR